MSAGKLTEAENLGERPITQGLASALNGVIRGSLESIEREHQRVVRELAEARELHCGCPNCQCRRCIGGVGR